MSKPTDRPDSTLSDELLDTPLRQLLDFARRGKAAQAKLDTLISAIHQAESDTAAPTRACRKCGCTDDDCNQCIKRTGYACSWIASDLCSACGPRQKPAKAARKVKAKRAGGGGMKSPRGVPGKTHPNGMPLERDGVLLNAAGKPRPACQMAGCGAQDGTVRWKVCQRCRAAGKKPGKAAPAAKRGKPAPAAKAAPPAPEEKPLGGAWAAQFRMRLKQETGLEGKPGVAAVIAMIAAGRTPTRSELPAVLR